MLLTGALLPPLDFFIVNVALPSIRTDLGATPAEVQLVISGYGAAYAVFLITGGRLGDLYGRRRLFLLGMAGFVLASALCGLARSPGLLVFGRILEGATAAVLAPQILGSMRALFAGSELSRAVSLYATTIGLAAAIGQLLGGVLIAADIWGTGWRAVFLVNLPIGACAIAGGLVLVPETSATAKPRLDVGGAALVSLALFALIVPLSEGSDEGWPGWSVGALAAVPLLLAGFLAYEDRLAARGGMPLLDLALLRVASFRRGVLAALLFFFTAPFYLFFSLELQAGRGLGPLATGLAILPYGIGIFIGPLVTLPLLSRLRHRLFAIGMAIQVTGYAAIGLCVALQSADGPLAAAVFVGGLGQGIAMPRLIDMVLSEIPPQQAGLAAGILNSTLQLGTSVSVALIGPLFFSVLGHRTGATAYGEAFAAAMAAVVTGLGLALVIGAMPLPRPARRRGQ